jgi:type I restriction enzyme R subunit
MTKYRDLSEDGLVEQPAIKEFATLGWDTLDCYHEKPGPGSPLGRATRADVVLPARLRPALEKLNPGLPRAAIEAAIEELARDRSIQTPAQANRELYAMLKDGVPVYFPDDEGGETVEKVRVIDWENPYNNDFLLCSQLWVTGELYTRRPDLIGFVNGLPLVFIELKASHVNIENAYQKNLRDYRDTIPSIFWHNAFIILSNGSDTLVGSTTAPWEHFAEWKKIDDEEEPGIISLETVIRGTCEPARLLDIVENFVLYSEEAGGLVKIVAKNHQYLGVNNAIQAVQDMRDNQGRLGVYWHTQGAGKSYSMMFFAQKVMRKLPGNWTFAVITDRNELDEQIYKTFQRAGAVTEENVQATSSANLRQLLQEDHRYVFTLIHKFRTERGARHPVLSERSDIIVMTDEAHRTQYDVLAQNMRDALPNAAFIGFTGTPLMVGEEKTREVFGDYVSVYDFRQSMADGATVPLYYENRIPTMVLTNDNFQQDMDDLLEAAALDEMQEQRLEREFNREYHIITDDKRLETVAADIVQHYMRRGYWGKAMVVSMDRLTAVKMYDKVQAHWQAEIARLQARLLEADDLEREELEPRIAYMQETDMAVVISSVQNEVDDFRQKGLDILPHRRRMVQEQLDEKFKKADDPLRIVFVCAMWMTGFDVKSCSTIYLDKPMKNHTLMQTIARANRVWGDKPNGLIVDYIGVFRSLQKALSIYGGGPDDDGDLPIRDKSALVDELRAAISAAENYCWRYGVDLAELLQIEDEFEFIARRDDAVEVLIHPVDVKQEFLELAKDVDKLYKAILPDPIAGEFGPLRAVLVNIARTIASQTEKPDITDVMADVEQLIEDSITPEGYRIVETTDDSLIDLSQIDFDALRERFKRAHKRTEVEKLTGALNRRVQEMARLNKSRVNYQERLQKLINEYNDGSRNVEEMFEELIQFTADLSEEDQRHIAEGLSEEELAVFDLLVRPGPDLTQKEITKVKAVVREMLETLKHEKLVLDWRKRQQARADVQHSIEVVLDKLPDGYDTASYEQKCAAVYEHVYEHYFGNGRSSYDRAA